MSSVDKLIEILQKGSKNPIKIKQIRKSVESKQDLLRKIKNHKRKPWRNSVQERVIEVKPLRNKCLDNWQIHRINNHLSNRSFQQNPSNIKVSPLGEEFMKISSKDKQGHLLYLYQSDLQKINRIRATLRQNIARQSKISRKSYFGIGFSRLRKSLHSSSIQSECLL